ncbi:ATP-binding cassette domain-containing protein [Nakamurella antarctica]|uniref:ATP-binding cassette domain-containing protein n=1 Tax=Nakamurella antarctica TaxID=1902245 RepID=A0A3G8ZPA1_9ACTN|nr:ATP-binding cassette domain-containing protein [Nakamurella antarctica]AZI59103.1 ATP-binding cassette domain-containing protein [Nakamurella antarctica]
MTIHPSREHGASALTGELVLRASIAERGVDLQLTLRAGEVVAVLGPNGAGKSTLLSLIAGLQKPDSGAISLDGRVLVDREANIWVPPHQRGVVLLAQQALLFEHLTALANVAFGPRSRGMKRSAANDLAQKWLGRVDASEFADRKPHQLSGGQAQRIAIARALAADPSLLLLDEPMAALDVAVSPALRVLLRQVLRGTGRTAVLVTHDLLDALALADRAIIIENGRITEDGPVKEIISRPRSAFAARIAGMNLISGTVTEGHLLAPDGQRVFGLVDPACQNLGAAVALFRPSAVSVHVESTSGSPRNQVPVIIAQLEPRGDLVRVHSTDSHSGAAGLIADITAVAAAELDLVPGKKVYFVVKAMEVTIYPALA